MLSPRSRGEKVITCGACFGILNDPITLDCRHSFCMECVRSRMERTGMSEGLICALCMTLHPAVTVRTLRDSINTDLVAYIQLLQKGVDGRALCQWCEEATATLHCPECSYALCADCNSAVHKNAAKRNHQVMPLTDSRALRTLTKKCSVRGHEEYRLEFYCVRCEELCCAYCLQVDPHKAHESIGINRAAQEARQQMGRDLEQMGQLKARIESMANELNRVSFQYQETYDHVESLMTDRFTAFKQQIMQRELELRKILASLREGGDHSLATSRSQYLSKLNSINEAGLQYRRLQNGGADYEVLQNRATMSAFLKIDVPQVSGTGFRVADLGDLTLTGLTINLDLNTALAGEMIQPSLRQQVSLGMQPPPSRGVSELPSSNGAAAGGGRGAAAATSSVMGPRGALASAPSSPAAAVSRFTFPADQDVETLEKPDGLLFRCSNRVTSNQVGLRSNETFEVVRRNFPEDAGIITWKVRLEMVLESFIGVVEKTDPSQVPEGFYWRPTKAGLFDGRAGRVASAMRSLPACKNGDVIRFTYECSAKVLKVAINGMDRGIVVSDLHPHLCPCFIFRPGESLTLLN